MNTLYSIISVTNSMEPSHSRECSNSRLPSTTRGRAMPWRRAPT